MVAGKIVPTDIECWAVIGMHMPRGRQACAAFRGINKTMLENLLAQSLQDIAQQLRTSVVPAKMQRVDDAAADGAPVQALLCLNVHHMQLRKHHTRLKNSTWPVPFMCSFAVPHQTCLKARAVKAFCTRLIM